MAKMSGNRFSSVFVRELKRIREHPLHVILLTIAFIFCGVFFLTMMNEGQPQDLPMGIVDQDGSYLSRRLTHEINAMQGVDVVEVYSNHKEAREAMQRQEIFSFIEIPAGTYQNLLDFKRPHIVLYTNNAFLLSGTLSYRSVMTIANLASGAVQREILRKKGFEEKEIMGMIQPIEIDSHCIGNPQANYSYYLTTTILFGMLGLFAILMTAYTIGIELKEKTSRLWLRCGGNSILPVLAGKVLPYTCWLSLMGIICYIVLFGFMHFPTNGSHGIMILAIILYVMAMQALGIVFIGAFPVVRIAVCVSALYGILAFSLSGFTYPVENMLAPVQALSYIFPLRHFYLIGVNEIIFGAGFAQSFWHLSAFLIFMLLPMLVFKRLQSALIYQNYNSK